MNLRKSIAYARQLPSSDCDVPHVMIAGLPVILAISYAKMHSLLPYNWLCSNLNRWDIPGLVCMDDIEWHSNMAPIWPEVILPHESHCMFDVLISIYDQSITTKYDKKWHQKPNIQSADNQWQTIACVCILKGNIPLYNIFDNIVFFWRYCVALKSDFSSYRCGPEQNDRPHFVR